MPLRAVFVCFLTAVIVACTPSPTADRAQLAAIFSEAKATIAFLLANPSADAATLPISEAMKSAGVTRLHKSNPGTLYDGLYLRVRESFTREWGYFVPSDPQRFRPPEGDDPSFEPLGEGVFWYEIKG
jgi:hypothetical protein